MRSILLSGILLFFISASAQDTTNMGKEFWVGYGHHQFMEGSGGNAQNMTIYLATCTQAATVTITIDSSGIGGTMSTWWWRTYNIPANSVIDIETTAANSYSSSAGAIGAIPKGVSGGKDARLFADWPPAGIGPFGLFKHKAIHIESDVPIVAYSHIYGSASSGATMLIPVEAWGGLYTSANSRQSYASNCYSWMYILAKYDNTVVEITPSVKTVGQNYTGLQPGVTKTITLMRGQIYQVLGANLASDANGNGGLSSEGLELTGTIVRSVTSPTGYIHPIAVFSGSSRTANPASCGSGGGDNDMQQHFPRQAMGRVYLTAPFSGSALASTSGTSIYKIVVFDPTTVVARNGSTLTSLQANGYYTFESNTPDIIQSDKPILVAQFMTGGSCLGGGSSTSGDPEMIYLNPLSQAIKSTNFFRTNKESITVQYLTLIIPTNGLSSLIMDGSPTPDYVYPHPQMPGYSVVVKRWAATKAQSIVQSDSAFVGITYGLGSVESYGYSLGTRLNAVYARDASQLPDGFTGRLFPLNLLDFTAVKKEKNVLLNWNTANEVNVDRFEVERSLNGREFTVISTVNSKQTSVASYDATDVNALVTFSTNPVLYYRLKMVDKDGSFKYSGVITVKLSSKTLVDVKAVPNPFIDKLQLQVQSEISGTAKINIRDVTGKLIESTSKLISKGSSFIEITSLGNLQKGVYVLEVELNGTRQYIKVVK